ncbi:MAG: DUF5522 domain-containing protein [Myxococcota bacterium]
MTDDIDALHLAAVRAGEKRYVDPATGYSVFTAFGHEERGYCCGSGCRHCPFGHERVSGTSVPNDPFLVGALDPTQGAEVDVLSWSGGKDSYLALRRLQREAVRPIMLLNTFDADSGVVAHQQLGVQTIREQAQALNLPVVLVPLRPHVAYVGRIALGLSVLTRRVRVARLCFGDLHLDEIRSWRERLLGPVASELGISLHFPVWNVDYQELKAELDASPVNVTVTSVLPEYVSGILHVGVTYDRTLREALPNSVDPFGERGEFHTRVDVRT